MHLSWATAAATFTSAANSAFSSSTDFFTLRTAFNIGFSAIVGGLGDWSLGSDDAVTAIYMWVIGVDAAMGSGLLQMGYDYAVED